MIQPLLIFSDWGILVLRIVLGALLLVHGWPKIKNLRGTGQAFEGMGFKAGVFWAAVVALVEFVGGLALIAGFFTQIVSFLVAVQFIVIILKLKLPQKSFMSFEFDLLILAASILLLTVGGGALSSDEFLGILFY